MQLFLVEGRYNNPIPAGGVDLDYLIDEELKKIRKRIKDEDILFWGIKENLSGLFFVMKAKDKEEVELFVKNDLLYEKGIVTYKIEKFMCRGCDEKFKYWFDN